MLRCVTEAQPGSSRNPLKIVVLASGTGTLLQSMLDTLDPQKVTIIAVGSDKECPALQRAQDNYVDTFLVPFDADAKKNRAHWDRLLLDAVSSFHPDFIVSAGFMKILGEVFLEEFQDRIINTHPALLPSFPGANAVPDALAHGVKVTGTTVHLIDAGVDTGPILAQASVPVRRDDTVDTLHERIKVVERKLLVDVLHQISESGIERDGRKAYIR